MAGYPMSIGGKKREEEWRAESDMETLIAAEKIKKDKKRFAAAKAMAKKKMEAMKAVQ